MNRKDLYNGFNEVDDDILERSERATISNVVPIRRRWPVALIAAILCLFLMGAGVVAVIYGDSIQNWFGHYFELVTGQNMSEGQTALIDHARSHGVDTIGIEIRKPPEGVIPAFGKRKHLRQNALCLDRQSSIPLMVIRHDGIALDLLDIKSIHYDHPHFSG